MCYNMQAEFLLKCRTKMKAIVIYMQNKIIVTAVKILRKGERNFNRGG